MKLFVVPCFLLFALLVLHVRESHSDCCYLQPSLPQLYPPVISSKCDDDTDPTPCCGYGPCDIICCKCEGGCRSKWGRGKRDVPQYDHFEQLDENGDGRLSLDEAQKWLISINTTDLAKAVQEVKKLDKDGDGYLTRTEIGA